MIEIGPLSDTKLLWRFTVIFRSNSIHQYDVASNIVTDDIFLLIFYVHIFYIGARSAPIWLVSTHPALFRRRLSLPDELPASPCSESEWGSIWTAVQHAGVQKDPSMRSQMVGVTQLICFYSSSTLPWLLNYIKCIFLKKGPFSSPFDH